jgi:hypothetical protein
MGALVPRQERERGHRGDDHQQRGQVIEKLVGLVDGEDLLDEHLHHVGKHLEDSPGTHTHGAQAALEIGTHLALHEDQGDGEERVGREDQHAHNHTLDQDRPEVSQAKRLAQERVEPSRYDTKIKHLTNVLIF